MRKAIRFIWGGEEGYPHPVLPGQNLAFPGEGRGPVPAKMRGNSNNAWEAKAIGGDCLPRPVTAPSQLSTNWAPAFAGEQMLFGMNV